MNYLDTSTTVFPVEVKIIAAVAFIDLIALTQHWAIAVVIKVFYLLWVSIYYFFCLLSISL